MASSDLEDFVKKNTPKKEVQTTPPDKSHSKSASHRAEDFVTVYKLLSGKHLTIAFGIALSIILFFGFKMLSRIYNLDGTSAALAVAIFAFVAIDLFIFYFAFHYLLYKKFLASGVSITGWRELVHNRSIDFWKGRTYLRIAFQIELSARATAVHHQALDIFLNQMLARWGSKHSGTWKNGAPSEMSRSGKGIEGHVAVHTGTTFLIRELAFHLPAFSKMLGDGLNKISFAAKGERAFESEKEEDPYEEERYRKMMERD